ncbi:MAG TPA: hypothetical protein VFH03_08965 [Actinoplanes sp.]|nr:hypothetical protein [Actinoplanes sp.]
MNIFRRRPKLPAEMRPPLESGERVLAWSPVGEAGGPPLVATNRGLWLPDGQSRSAAENPGGKTTRRLGWHEIHKAAWSGRELRITPAEVAEVRPDYAVLIDAPVLVYLLLEPGELPDQVRTRVTRSVAYTVHHPLPVGGVRVVGRRVSGVDGLSWAVRYDAGTPVDAEPVVQVTGELVAAAQGATAPPD